MPPTVPGPWRRALAGTVVALGAVLAAGCATTRAPDYATILAAPDRLAADRAVDERRKTAELLAFIDARPGMRVLEMGAGGGYTAELLARAVGPSGAVHAQIDAAGAERVKDRWAERAARPVMQNVVRHVRPFDDPIPAEVGSLDRITFLFAYHDVTYLPADRVRMNQRLFAALKPGGTLILADHSAQPGAGISVARTLHRIEESTVRRELEAAGFRLAGSADFLRNPADPRSEPVFRPKQPNDEFVLRFERPR